MNNQHEHRPRLFGRFRVRFRLRTLFIAVFIVACFSLVFVKALQWSRAREHAIVLLRAEDVRVTITPSRAKWLGRYAEDPLFASVESIDHDGIKGDSFFIELRHERISQKAIAALELFPELQSVTLDRAMIDDDDLFHLRKLRRLNVLLIAYNPAVTGRGFAHLTKLQALESVGLEECGIDEAGLKCLSELHWIRSLNLAGCRITDREAVHLGSMWSLYDLNLYKTQIGDTAVKELQSLRSLAYLDLEETRITDEALRYLGQMKSLRNLSLSGSRISDAGLTHLVQLGNLEHLFLTGTGVSQAGAQALGSALPQTKIAIYDE